MIFREGPLKESHLSIFVFRFTALVIVPLPALAAAPPAPTDLDHCNVCHSADNTFPRQETLETCDDCHDPPHTIAEGHYQDPHIEGAPLKNSHGDLLPGMALPMYYEHTRIGTHPNEMVLVPPGEFTMGTDERLPDEGPAHKVTLKAFYIDKYEVTNGQYKEFIDATGHKSPSHFENRIYPDGKVDHPVTHVTWYDARDYCEWAGKRLPTDQEWEKAARGTDTRYYPWGNDFGIDFANTPQFWGALERDGDTSPVGAFPAGASPYGGYDMSGNVWEWTASWYQAYPGNQRHTENYGETYKTLKGGSWWDCSFYKCGISAPSFNRAFFLRTTKNKSFGFRCAKDAEDKEGL